MVQSHLGFFLVLLYFVNYLQPARSTKEGIYVYSYASTLSSLNHTALNHDIRGNVLVKFHALTPQRKPSGASPGAQRFLLHLLVDLESTSGPLQALVLREESGPIERIFFPPDSETNSLDIRLNFVKAIAGLFNYNFKFEPGVEYDSSGRCQTFYAEVVDSPVDKFNSEEVIVVDKQKTMCNPISEPLDAGVWSFSPIFKEKHLSHSYMRFFIQRKTGLLTRARTSEQHKLSFDLDNGHSGENSFSVTGEQILDMIPDGSTKSKILQKLSDNMKTFSKGTMDAVATAVLGERYKTHHLALSIPSSQVTHACAIKESILNSDNIDSQYLVTIERILKRNVEAFQTVLDAPARISSVHASLQLVSFLRCLPSSSEVVDLSAKVLNFIPKSTQDLHRQLDCTWYDQLFDVLINCGSQLCENLLLNRLLKVTELSSLEQKGSKVPADIKSIRNHLLNTMWPALMHINKPSLSLVREFTSVCLSSMPKLIEAVDVSENVNPYNCLLTIAGLNSLLSGRNSEKMLTSKIVDSVRTSIQTINEAFVDDHRQRQSLLAAFATAERLQSSLLAPVLFDVVENLKIPAILRFVALRTLSNFPFGKDRSQLAQIRSHLLNLIESPISPSKDELVIKYGAFQVLLNIETPALDLAQVLANFAEAKLWSLVASCRNLVSNWCQQELLSEGTCRCIQTGGPLRDRQGNLEHPIKWCKPGLAAGWSGLAGDKSAGSVNIVSGDLIDQRPSFLSDYLLQWIQGPDGEFRASNLAINLVGSQSEAKLMSFNIYGDNLATLMGKGASGSTSSWISVGFSLLRGVVPPQQVFSGGLSDIMGILLSAPTKPTPFFKSLRLPLDVRHYIQLSSGWLIRSDILGASSIEISAALQSSMWTQSGKSLLRTRAAFAMEHFMTLITPQPPDSPPHTIVHGMGAAVRIDFVTRAEMAGLPDSICMTFQRDRSTPLIRWSGELQGNCDNMLKPLPTKTEEESSNRDYVFTHVIRISPVSYFLGAENSKKCTKMGGSNMW